ncbi:hypothetical protein M5K25_012022 [Dendrobium thyrsiflorum]|uniref:Uncharacterized protein n=1 Tax=Dendrobium thyrsiflorum TaxID=117978 RepID=A0ABD0VBC9_DENTH
MALWVRSGGYGGIRRFPGILLPRPLVAAERAWKKGKERKGWVRAMRCSLQWEADTQPYDQVREMVMEKGEVGVDKWQPPVLNSPASRQKVEVKSSLLRLCCAASRSTLLRIVIGILHAYLTFHSPKILAASRRLPCLGKTTGDCNPTTLRERHVGIMCDLCNGIGWLICDFCRGQKTNVKSESSRFYRRCPYCKAVGLVLCPKCKVFKCVTFPEFSDSEA